MRLMDYIELVDWTGRQLRKGKTGYIESNTPPILQRLNIEQKNWLKACPQFERQRALLIGSSRSIQAITSKKSNNANSDIFTQLNNVSLRYFFNYSCPR